MPESTMPTAGVTPTRPSRLESALPTYDVEEVHHRVIAASPDAVWQALTTIAMTDLWMTRVMMAVRHLGTDSSRRSILDDGPVTTLERDRPRYVIGGKVSRPWRRSSPVCPIVDLAALRDFDEPDWVVIGTDFTLTAVPAGTLLSTRTRCRATSEAARRRFRVYWTLIRPFSGVVRREVLATVARAAEAAESR